jgi:predicted ATPase
VGPNAAGKSNLLDVFRFLRDVCSVGGGFQSAVRQRGGVSKLRALAARRYSDLVVSVRIGDDEEPALWGYELRFTQDNQRRPQIAREVVTKAGKELFVRPDAQDDLDKERLTQTVVEQVHANREFREVPEFLAGVRYLHIVPQLIREPSRLPLRENDPYGGDFLEHMLKTPATTRNAWLRRIQEALGVAVPQLTGLEAFRDEHGVAHLKGKYEHWRPQGAWQNEDQFSDGTLRLIGLLWSVLDGSGPLLLEEPELSLHPEVVRYVPQMFARVQRRTGRQIMLSSHSPDLMRDDGIGLDEVLLLIPETEGTSVASADRYRDIETSPKRASQLSFFGSK